jgi:hypothetical protein
LSYYDRAMNHFPEDAQCIIFSDDIEWCKRQTTFSKSRRPHAPAPFFAGRELSALDVIQLMAACTRGGITANSTLSWWGGFLNPSQTKRVVMPTPWFTNAWDTSGLYWPGSTVLSVHNIE